MNKPLRSGIAGAIATGVALGASELIAGVLRGATSLVAAVGQFVIDHQPPGAKDVVVALFGTNDKLALELFVVIVALAIGAGLGVVALRRPWLTMGAFVAFGIVGFLAALGDPDGTEPAIAAAATAVAVGSGLWILERLLPRETMASAERETGPSGSMPDWDRRSFLVRAGSYGAAAIVAGVAGRTLLDRQRSAPSFGGTPLPPPSDTVADLPPGADMSPTIEGLTPLVMPNDRFYRIDTSLLPPVIDVDTWTLKVHGMVERETTLTFAELVGLPMFEQYVTIACVSNEVGGNLVGNAKWTGVRLREVLELAGVQPGRDATGRPVRRRLDRRHADGVGHGSVPRTDDRAQDERRATAGHPRLPGPAHHPRALRLRVGDQVAVGPRADHDGGLRRLLGPARLGQGGADPHAVAHRRAGSWQDDRERPRSDRGHRLGTGPRRVAGRGRGRR